MKYILSPSILAADFGHLQEDISRVRAAGATYLHIDVMDGHFVPSISFGFPVIASVRSHTDMILDVHLMIEEPVRYLEAAARAGADIITVHYEACQDVKVALQQIKELGCRAGLTIKPDTGPEVLYPYLSMVDMILIMTVEPGFGGQAYIAGMTEKIRTVRAHADQLGIKLDIEVDGGINDSTLRTVLDAGANVIVAGSAVFGGDIKANTERYLKVMGEYA